MHTKILTTEQETLLKVERHWLTNLQVALARLGAEEADRAALAESVRQLDELFLLVVVGEFNAGKSAFINALLGAQLLEEGVTPTTTRVHQLKYGETFEQVAIENGVDVYTVPADLLREINIVDTPGTNAIHREHEAITQDFVPRSDLVLFVTSVDRPFTESERAFLETIRGWGKKIIVVLNKIDILNDPAALEEIQQFITENARTLLGFVPEIFPVSARQALQAKQAHDAELLKRSGFETLEQYICTTLDETERIRLKLSNPLGVGIHLAERYIQALDGQLDLLRDDFKVMEDVEQHMEMYRSDMKREFRLRLAKVDNVLYQFERRGDDYFDETLRIGRVFDLMQKRKLEEEFSRIVVADFPEQVATQVEEMIDWLISSNLRQWQAVMEHVMSRRDKHADRIVGHVGGDFDYDRTHLIDTVGQTAKRAMESYEYEAESRKLAESLQMAVASTALVEVSAVGLGAVLTAVATTAAADVTGILAASTVAVMGLFVIPAKRRSVKRELHAKISTIRQKLMAALTTQFERELVRSVDAIEIAIAPYTRFIRSEKQRIEHTKQELETIKGWLVRQQEEIESTMSEA